MSAIPTYEQPRHFDRALGTEDRPDGDLGHHSPGKDCVHCGQPGHAHQKVKVHADNGTWYYRYMCNTGPGDK